MHRLEKMWLTFGVAMLAVFLIVLGIGVFANGAQPPTTHAHGGHEKPAPELAEETAPFDKPGLHKIGDNEYKLVMVAIAFAYKPLEDKIVIPAGATVHFEVTSTDVVHGLQIPGTNVNMMAVPGETTNFTFTFKKPGEYLVLCNEYCGNGHEMMWTTITVA